MKLPELSSEAAEALLAKKKAFAAEQGNAEDACQNLKCRCVECTCGAACTCNISPEVNCDPCKDFKAGMIKKNNAERLKAAEGFFAEKIKPQFSEILGIRGPEVLQDQDLLVLIDVRSKEEQEVSKVAGAVTVDEFEANMDIAKGKTIVPYCLLGGRSAAYCRRLLEMPEQPWAGVKNLEVGVVDWCHCGGSLVDSAGASTTKIHVWKDSFLSMMPVQGYEVTTDPPCKM